MNIKSIYLVCVCAILNLLAVLLIVGVGYRLINLNDMSLIYLLIINNVINFFIFFVLFSRR
jgi:hypothetical protein